MGINRIADEITKYYDLFKINHTKHAEGNKAAGRRARGNALEISKLCKTYRKASTKHDDEIYKENYVPHPIE